MSKDKFQLCGLIFEDLGICLLALFFLCACFFFVIMMSLRIIGAFKFHDIENPHDNLKACTEFINNIMWPMGTLIIFVIPCLLTVIIQPHKQPIIRDVRNGRWDTCQLSCLLDIDYAPDYQQCFTVTQSLSINSK